MDFNLHHFNPKVYLVFSPSIPGIWRILTLPGFLWASQTHFDCILLLLLQSKLQLLLAPCVTASCLFFCHSEFKTILICVAALSLFIVSLWHPWVIQVSCLTGLKYASQSLLLYFWLGGPRGGGILYLTWNVCPWTTKKLYNHSLRKESSCFFLFWGKSTSALSSWLTSPLW